MCFEGADGLQKGLGHGGDAVDGANRGTATGKLGSGIEDIQISGTSKSVRRQQQELLQKLLQKLRGEAREVGRQVERTRGQRRKSSDELADELQAGVCRDS